MARQIAVNTVLENGTLIDRPFFGIEAMQAEAEKLIPGSTLVIVTDNLNSAWVGATDDDCHLFMLNSLYYAVPTRQIPSR